MKTTNLKSKIMAGALCATLVGGVGTAFASTDAGEQLGNWYTSQVTPSLNRVWTGAVNYITPQVQGLFNWKAGVQGDSVAAVRIAGTDEIARANTAIGEAKQAYIDAIEIRQGQIEAGMQGQYDGKVNSTNTTINRYANSAQSQAMNEIGGALETQKCLSLTAVGDEVGATKTQAIEDLKAAIAKATSELQGLMDAKELAATNAVKANLDEQIRLKKEFITTETAKLEQAKKDAITAKGAEMETNAKADLDALVDLIDGVVTPK